ncbi:MAG: HAD-IIIA family hydrolase [Elusimicrobia bacterium]|nr:HAD-IIIA family hydrolase [Elusimicrobiota bacterium]
MLKKIDLILYYGLFVLAFVMPISIAATNTVWIFLFFIWIIKIAFLKSGKNSIDFSPPLTSAILIFFCSAVISSIFGVDFRRSIKGLNENMLFFIFFLTLSNVKNFNHAKKIIFIFIVSSSIMGLLGLIQYITGISFDYGKLLYMLDGRAHGTRSWPQTYAEGLLLAFPVSISAVLYLRKKIFYITSILIFSGIIFSYVRMVWISTTIILVVLLFIEIKRLKNLTYIFTALLILAVASSFFLPGRLNIIKRATNFSDPVRTNMWKTGLKIFRDYPLLGVGLKNIKKVYPYYYQKLNFLKEFYKLSHLHSTFIHILVERGIIGFLVFLYLFAIYFYYGIKKAKCVSEEEKFFIYGCLFSVFGFLLSGLTEHTYGDSEIQMIMWFLMALTFYKSRAVFIDRDGTINEDMHYSADERKLEIMYCSYPAIKLLNQADYKVIIITNQSGVARGNFSEKDVKKLNEVIIKKLKEKDAVINDIYLCPHHPDENCNCRKPKPGMILRAKKNLNIDIKNSYMVGDMQSDIDLAKNVGAKSVFVLTGAGIDVKGADYTAEDILDAAEWIVRQN